jgi:heme exporter protein B
MTLATLLKQDLRISIRQRSDIVLLLVFTILAALLFPMALGPDPQVLQNIAIGLIWVLVLLASHMASPTVWRQDIEDGTLEQLILNGIPCEWIVLSKTITVWLLSFGSLFILLPFLGTALGITGSAIPTVLITFVIASLPLSFLTVTGGLMTCGNPRAAILSTIIMLPLYLPLFIFSCSACEGEFLPMIMLAGISLTLCPILLYINVLLLNWLPE